MKIEADELYKSDTSSRTVHAVAAAVAGTVTDQRPYPGAFTISFPDGPPPEISSPGDLINNVQIQADPTDSLQTAAAGDYPQTALSFYTIAGLPDPDPNHPQFENVLSTALYDWLKRGGVTVNVQVFDHDFGDAPYLQNRCSDSAIASYFFRCGYRG